MLRARREGPSVRVWVKVDSGMHRLGFAAAELPAVWRELARSPAVARPMHVMSHFASADEPGRGATVDQIARFDEMLAALGGSAPPPASLANSAAVLTAPASHREWARPGMMLYGVSPMVGGRANDHGLRPAMTLTAPLVAVKTIEPRFQSRIRGHLDRARTDAPRARRNRLRGRLPAPRAVRHPGARQRAARGARGAGCRWTSSRSIFGSVRTPGPGTWRRCGARGLRWRRSRRPPARSRTSSLRGLDPGSGRSTDETAGARTSGTLRGPARHAARGSSRRSSRRLGACRRTTRCVSISGAERSIATRWNSPQRPANGRGGSCSGESLPPGPECCSTSGATRSPRCG